MFSQTNRQFKIWQSHTALGRAQHISLGGGNHSSRN
jgi:hypothetical protein